MTFPLWIKYWASTNRSGTTIRTAVLAELAKTGTTFTQCNVTLGDVPGHVHLPTNHPHYPCCATVEVRNPSRTVTLDHTAIADAIGDSR